MRRGIVFWLMVLLFMGAVKAWAIGFQNPSFETGDFAYWTTGGIVSVITGNSYVSSPKDGNYMALISMPGNPPDYAGGGYVYENYISQRIDASVGQISFWYNLFTTDYDYDQPAFMVKINGQEVFSIDAEDVLDEWQDPVYYTGWTLFTYDLSSYTGLVDVAIYAGNTDDNYYNSWAYIDCFSPQEIFSPQAPIPEPATALLLLGALPELHFWHRKK